jgi:unsaturated rhamnogalacturonyl hydrolase
MSNSTARLARILPQVKARGTGLPGFLLVLFAASCQSGNSAPNPPAAGAGQTSSEQTGGASGMGGQDTAAATGGTSGPAGSSSATISGGTTASGGAPAGGTSSPVAGGSGGAGAGGTTGGGGATRTGGTTGQAGSTSNGTASVAGGAGRGGASGGVPGTAGTTGVAGSTSKGGSGGASAVDAGAAGQGGGDAGTSTLAADSFAVRFANMIISKWPDPKDINTTAGFEYNHGIVLRGMEQVYRHTKDSSYLAYIQKYVDENVTASGVVSNLGTTFSAFDNMQPSVLLPFLYQETGTAKYKTAADSVQAFYAKIPTNGDGGYWHKQAYPNQMWLDGIYMGEPFLARYGAVFGTCSTCGDTVVKQTTLIAAHTLDQTTGLYYHAWWDDNPTGTTKPAWADANGRSPCIWGRAMGWYAMALVDTLGDLPASQTGRSDLMTILTGVAAGLKATQDAKTGLWYQVMDQGSKTDNWTETSGSGMFVYALKVAVNRGYIDSSYSAVADKGWTGLQTMVKNDASGAPTITGAVNGMNVQNNYAGYVGQKTLTNSSHGLCAILLAAAEMEAR